MIELGADKSYVRRRQAEQAAEEKNAIPQKVETKTELTSDEEHWLSSGGGFITGTDIFS